MRLLFLVITTLILNVSLKAQVTIRPLFSLDYTYRVLDKDDLRDSYEKGNLNARFGIDAEFSLNRNLSIVTGLRYVNYSYSTNDVDQRWPEEITEMGYINDPLTAFAGTEAHKYSFYEVPINLRYYLTTGKISYFVEGGLSTNYSTVDEWGERYSVNEWNLSGNFGGGLEIQMLERLSLNVKPVVRYHFTPTLEARIRENLFSVGGEVGVGIRL